MRAMDSKPCHESRRNRTSTGRKSGVTATSSAMTEATHQATSQDDVRRDEPQ
jgi:hypothetical protein